MNKNRLENLCADLQSLLKHELDAGNRIIAVETGWSKVTLAVRLGRPLDIEYIKKTIADIPDLEIWESHDSKNPQEAGVLCRSTKQTLSGAISDKS